MLSLGIVNSLCVRKQTTFGLYLGNAHSDQVVLLPNKYVPEGLKIGDSIDVFLYTDSEDRIIATTLTPKILLHQLSVLEVKEVTRIGAFLDWGLEKDLFLPFGEQEERVRKGDWVAVCLCLDRKTERLLASSKLKRLIKRELTVEEGEEVDLVIGRRSDLGYQVIINNLHIGLIFHNEVFQTLHEGDMVKGYIKSIREDGKIDVSLQKQGYAQVVDSQDLLLKKLQENNGVLYLTDKSDPNQIARELSMSKKVFKKCVGALYKQKKIKIESDRIVLCD